MAAQPLAEQAFHIAVDLGTTYTAAAVVRGRRVEPIVLGHRSALVPSVVWFGPGDEVLIGDAALRRGVREPAGLVREFKRRLGDNVPFVVRGRPVSAVALTATLLRLVVEEVVAREGGRPQRLAVTHPAKWGPHRLGLLQQAIGAAGIADAVLVSEPEAAALFYAAQGRIADGENVIVYDLGGGTFDVAILQRRGDEFVLLGHPDGVDRLGGVDFDQMVLDHVLAAASVDEPITDEAWRIAVRRLHGECVEAKEALSADVSVDVDVIFPARHVPVRLSRKEFEELVRPSLLTTIDAVRRALESSGLRRDDVARVLLVGGSSRIPLVSEIISSQLGLAVSVDVQPKFAVVLGAALAVASGGTIDERITVASVEAQGAPGITRLVPSPTGSQATPADESPTPRPRRSRRMLVAAVVGASTLAVIAAMTVAARRDDKAGERPTSTSMPATVDVAGAPSGLTTAFDAVWVVTADGELADVDPSSGSVRRRTSVAATLDDVVADRSHVWVSSSDAVYRVDPRDLSTKRLAMPAPPDGMASAGTGVWVGVAGSESGALYLLDETNATARLVGQFPVGITEVAVGDDFLWLATTGPVLYRVDTRTFDATAVAVDAAADGIVLAFGELWATFPATNFVVHCDPMTGTERGRIATASGPGEITPGDDRVWVSEQGANSVAAIEPTSHTIVSRLSVGAAPDRLIWRAPHLWVADSGGTVLSVVSP